jgi:hypothetical protein
VVRSQPKTQADPENVRDWRCPMAASRTRAGLAAMSNAEKERFPALQPHFSQQKQPRCKPESLENFEVRKRLSPQTGIEPTT